MPNSNLLVAGTGGITLMDSQGNDLGYPGPMAIGSVTGGLIGLPPDSLVELLSMEHKAGQIGPVKTSLKEGLSIRPGHVIETAYNQVPSSVNRFLYDWRADMRWSASALRDFIVQRKPPGGRWNIVGHSQGALLIVMASKLFAKTTEFADYVASVTLVAGPLCGTINAAHAIVAGDLFASASNAAFQQITQTWPSIYQMCPDSSWQDAVVDQGGAAVPAQPLSSILPGFSSDMQGRWATARQLLKDPFQSMDGDIQALVIMARTRATGVNLELADGKLTSQSHAFDLGDTLVPWQRTMSWLGSAASFARTMLGPINEHAYLFNDPSVWGEVQSALRP